MWFSGQSRNTNATASIKHKMKNSELELLVLVLVRFGVLHVCGIMSCANLASDPFNLNIMCFILFIGHQDVVWFIFSTLVVVLCQSSFSQAAISHEV